MPDEIKQKADEHAISLIEKHLLNKKALAIVQALEYPLDVLLVKHLVRNCGIQSEDELVELLKTQDYSKISQFRKVALHNAYRDVYVIKGMYNENKIPNIFK